MSGHTIYYNISSFTEFIWVWSLVLCDIISFLWIIMHAGTTSAGASNKENSLGGVILPPRTCLQVRTMSLIFTMIISFTTGLGQQPMSWVCTGMLCMGVCSMWTIVEFARSRFQSPWGPHILEGHRMLGMTPPLAFVVNFIVNKNAKACFQQAQSQHFKLFLWQMLLGIVLLATNMRSLCSRSDASQKSETMHQLWPSVNTRKIHRPI